MVYYILSFLSLFLFFSDGRCDVSKQFNVFDRSLIGTRVVFIHLFSCQARIQAKEVSYLLVWMVGFGEVVGSFYWGSRRAMLRFRGGGGALDGVVWEVRTCQYGSSLSDIQQIMIRMPHSLDRSIDV